MLSTRQAQGLTPVVHVSGCDVLQCLLVDWAQRHGVQIEHIQPGKPARNAYIERFNRTYREEVLDMHLLCSLKEVRELTERWIQRYVQDRPHEALGGLPPDLYAASVS